MRVAVGGALGNLWSTGQWENEGAVFSTSGLRQYLSEKKLHSVWEQEAKGYLEYLVHRLYNHSIFFFVDGSHLGK